MARLALRLGVLASLNLLIAFLIQWWILVAIGPGGHTDALFAGLAVPQVLLVVVNSSLIPVLVPLLAGKPEHVLRSEAWGFVLLLGALFLFLCAALVITAGIWVPSLFPGFPPTVQSLTVGLARIQIGAVFFSVLAAVMIAAYRAQHRFFWPELAQLVVLVAGLLALLWALPAMGIGGAAWVFLLRAILLVMLLAPVLGTFRRPNWSAAIYRDAWRRIRPLLAGTAYYKSGPLVDRYLSSFVPPGGLSNLYFGQQILDGLHNVLNKALTTPLLTRLAHAAQQNDWRGFRHLYLRQVIFVSVLMSGTVLLLLVVGKPVLHLFVGHGAVTEENVDLLWLLLVCMSGFLIGGGLGQPLSTAFYAVGETKIPTTIGVIGFTAGVVLKVVLFFRWGLPGIALGLTVHHLLNGFVFLVFVERATRKRINAGAATPGN